MAECKSIKPKACGGLNMPYIPDVDCSSIRFTGAGDVTINQGTSIDLTSGVHAYDGNGNEIPFTVSPSTIDTCTKGMQTVTYRATGVSSRFAPYMCGENSMHLSDCDTATGVVIRTITVKGISDPVISGVESITIDEGDTFNPMDGVSAVDGNNNPLTVTYTGTVDTSVEGTYELTYTAVDSCGNRTTITRTVIVEGEEMPWWVSPTGIQGNVPSIGGDPFITPALINPLAVKQTIEAVVDTAVSDGYVSVDIKAAILNAYLMKYSHYIVYGTEFADVLNYDPWAYVMRDFDTPFEATPISGADYLENIAENYRAWLSLFDTNTDYPAMQCLENNQYYANRDIYQEINASGAIYLDCRNSGDFTDSYSIVYGHDANAGGRFGQLYQYRNQSYFSAHRNGIIITNGAIYDLTAFAVVHTIARELGVYDTANTAQDVIDFITSEADTTELLQYDGDVAVTTDHILALSTCMETGTNEDRLVVFFKMSNRTASCGEVTPLEVTDVTSVTIELANPSDEEIEATVDGQWDGAVICPPGDDCSIENLTPGTVYDLGFRKSCSTAEDGYVYYDGEPIHVVTPHEEL